MRHQKLMSPVVQPLLCRSHLALRSITYFGYAQFYGLKSDARWRNMSPTQCSRIEIPTKNSSSSTKNILETNKTSFVSHSLIQWS